MDRNDAVQIVVVIVNASLSARRAWIEIDAPSSAPYAELRSLSARRAWIEISIVIVILRKRKVALRKESVDRNSFDAKYRHLTKQSLSARRAWIEITQCRL